MEDVSGADIEAAARAMDDGGQQALFLVGRHQPALDRKFAERAYLSLDPTRLYHCPVDRLCDPAPARMTGFSIWPPLQIQRDIWNAGGIGPARQAVMERAAGPKVALLGRGRDQPAAAAFVAIHEGIAMVHALEVRRDLRRCGIGATTMRHAARWAAAEGAHTLAVLVTEANEAANALYRGLGMVGEPCYHYRIRP